MARRAATRASTPPPSAARLRGQAPATLRARLRELRERLREIREATVPRLADHAGDRRVRVGRRPDANTGNGFYGKYQFTLETWAAVGGSGNPAEASEAEQDRRATMLYAQAGASPWPVCGR